jgi:hypothetical protein
MATKYCPKCKKVVIAKVLGRYSRVEINSVAGKKHKVGHLEEDGGCGHM